MIRVIGQILIPFMVVSPVYAQESSRAAGESPEHISGLVIEDLLSRDGFMMYMTDEVRAVHYAEVCTAFGAARLAGWKKDQDILQRLSERYLKVIVEGIENTANHVDANVYGILPLELYQHTGDGLFFEQGIELADGQWENPLPDGLTSQTRYWIDDVWMIGSLQVQAYRITQEGKVEGVCVGTGQSRQIDYYLDRPTVTGDFHGQAPVLWLAYRLMLE